MVTEHTDPSQPDPETMIHARRSDVKCCRLSSSMSLLSSLVVAARQPIQKVLHRNALHSVLPPLTHFSAEIAASSGCSLSLPEFPSFTTAWRLNDIKSAPSFNVNASFCPIPSSTLVLGAAAGTIA